MLQFRLDNEEEIKKYFSLSKLINIAFFDDHAVFSNEDLAYDEKKQSYHLTRDAYVHIAHFAEDNSIGVCVSDSLDQITEKFEFPQGYQKEEAADSKEEATHV